MGETVNNVEFKVCCFQTGFYQNSRQNRLTEIKQQLGRAREQGIQLVVYPQYWGLNLIYPEESGDSLKLLNHLKQEGQAISQAFIDVCGNLARESGLYLLPGSILEIKELSAGETDCLRVQNRAYLFSPQGQVILEQAQTHFSSWEEEMLFKGTPLPSKLQLEPDDGLQVVNTPLGMLGLVLGTDARYPEVSRILTLQGAQVLLALTALPLPYNSWRQVAGMWQQVQQNQIYCIEACLTGNFLAVTFAGKSSIYGPCEVTPGETGVFAQAESATELEDVIAGISLERLAEIRSRYPLSKHYNVPLYRQELGRVYRLTGLGKD